MTWKSEFLTEAIRKNEVILDASLRELLGEKHLGEVSISTSAADLLRLLGLPSTLLHHTPEKDFRITITPFDREG